MKVKNLLLVVLLCATTSVFGQLRLGLVAGPNFSNIAGSDATDNAMKVGVHGGVRVDLGITPHFFVEGDVLYSGKGYQGSSDSNNKLNLSYIEIPIVAKYKMDSGLNFFLGPYVGFLMSATFEPGGHDVKDAIESTDFGGKVGIGYELASGLGFNAHYEMGFAKIYKEVLGTQSNVTNTLFGISVSYMFGGK